MANTHVKNIKLGACKVSFGGQDLGYTKGGVEVEVSTETLKVTVDQLGQTTISELVQGRNVKVTAPLAESVLANLVNLMPGSTMSEDKNTLSISSAQGVNLVDVAQELILTPQDGTDFVLTLPKAATAGNFTMAYKSDDVRVFSVDFNAYPDDDGILGTMTNPKPNAGGASLAVTGVAVNPTTANIAVGGTTQLAAVFAPTNATDKTGTWVSSNTAVATVDSTGKVTGKAAGNTQITFTTTDGAKTASTAITVA